MVVGNQAYDTNFADDNVWPWFYSGVGNLSRIFFRMKLVNSFRVTRVDMYWQNTGLTPDTDYKILSQLDGVDQASPDFEAVWSPATADYQETEFTSELSVGPNIEYALRVSLLGANEPGRDLCINVHYTMSNDS